MTTGDKEDAALKAWLSDKLSETELTAITTLGLAAS
jgi:hypothetical protein